MLTPGALLTIRRVRDNPTLYRRAILARAGVQPPTQEQRTPMLDEHMLILSELIDKAKLNLAREVERRGNGPGTQDEGFYRGVIAGYELAYELTLRQKLEQEARGDGQ